MRVRVPVTEKAVNQSERTIRAREQFLGSLRVERKTYSSVVPYRGLLWPAPAARSTRKWLPSTDRPVDPSRVVEGDRLRVERAARAGRKSPPNEPTDEVYVQ